MINLKKLKRGDYLTLIPSQHTMEPELFKLCREMIKPPIDDYDILSEDGRAWIGELVQPRWGVMLEMGVLLYKNHVRKSNSNEAFKHFLAVERYKQREK
jgi:hypothetical protein